MIEQTPHDGIYRCRSCEVHFRASVRSCTVCGDTSIDPQRDSCPNCGISFRDGRFQTCPNCGSDDVEVVGRE